MSQTVPTSTAPLLTATQVAERLAISTTAVYSLCDSGELPAFRIGCGKKKRFRVDPRAVEEFLERSRVQPAGERVAKPRRATKLQPGGFSLLRAAGWKG
ncbi:MAG: DNA-binding protein [Caulobacteraceae bacterium]|nr:DNA-binding protein [Caulobacteraceae bacterium]